MFPHRHSYVLDPSSAIRAQMALKHILPCNEMWVWLIKQLPGGFLNW